MHPLMKSVGLAALALSSSMTQRGSDVVEIKYSGSGDKITTHVPRKQDWPGNNKYEPHTGAKQLAKAAKRAGKTAS